MNKYNVDICFLNVGGLKSKNNNKVNDPCFLKQIGKHDIILLAETHVGYDTSINIPGYLYFPICRAQSKNGWYFGGLAVIYKAELKPGIKILPITNTNFHWFKLDKDFINFERDIYTCLMYNPPVQSLVTQSLIDKSILDLLNESIEKFKNIGDILLCGDSNARVGNDFISNDNN